MSFHTVSAGSGRDADDFSRVGQTVHFRPGAIDDDQCASASDSAAQRPKTWAACCPHGDSRPIQSTCHFRAVSQSLFRNHSGVIANARALAKQKLVNALRGRRVGRCERHWPPRELHENPTPPAQARRTVFLHALGVCCCETLIGDMWRLAAVSVSYAQALSVVTHGLWTLGPRG